MKDIEGYRLWRKRIHKFLLNNNDTIIKYANKIIPPTKEELFLCINREQCFIRCTDILEVRLEQFVPVPGGVMTGVINTWFMLIPLDKMEAGLEKWLHKNYEEQKELKNEYEKYTTENKKYNMTKMFDFTKRMNKLKMNVMVEGIDPFEWGK